MTPPEIMQIVNSEASDNDFSYGESNNLVRYFIKKYCVTMTNDAIAKLLNVNPSAVSRSIANVESDRKYQFVKHRITRIINEEILITK